MSKSKDIREAVEGELSFDPLVEAATAAQWVSGVKNVHNHLEVMLPEGDYRDHANPADVTLLVQDTLDRNVLILDDSDVAVGTCGNTVTLTGHVRTWAEHDAAVRGRLDVQQRLRGARQPRRHRLTAAAGPAPAALDSPPPVASPGDRPAGLIRRGGSDA